MREPPARFAKEVRAMMNWTKAGRQAARLVEGKLDVDDLYDELDALRDTVHEVSARVGQRARRGYSRARDLATETAQEAEEVMKDNFAASLILALGLGVLVGYFIRRSTE
jgi:hypothetical protein